MTTNAPRPDDDAPAAEAVPLKAAADDHVEVGLTVNGTPATLRLPPRMTLADALRDRLGLTGTHLGCEHGVCGMCTVLINGEAARACLLFAVQLAGAEIVTVEGLGKPDQLHPLQEAFGRHHALQCGFCTPGFLLSSYDLLTHQPDVSDDELPEELSGVLCRCTGYRNIVTAVAEVRGAYSEGIPGPANCGARPLVGRAGAQLEPNHVTTSEAPKNVGDARLADVVLPAGEPSVTANVSTEIPIDQGRVWGVFDDVDLLARCLPGAEIVESLGEDRHTGRARVSIGPIKLNFNGLAHIVEHDRSAQRLRVLARGNDTGGSQVHGAVVLRTETTESGTLLTADAEIYLSGRVAQFGRALAGDISRQMFEQFAEAVKRAATTGATPPRAAKPPNAIRLFTNSVGASLRRGLARLRRSP